MGYIAGVWTFQLHTCTITISSSLFSSESINRWLKPFNNIIQSTVGSSHSYHLWHQFVHQLFALLVLSYQYLSDTLQKLLSVPSSSKFLWYQFLHRSNTVFVLRVQTIHRRTSASLFISRISIFLISTFSSSLEYRPFIDTNQQHHSVPRSFHSHGINAFIIT